ncbi:aminotransferase class I/II-fold pyridoxal phosphate-dependent enzyme [candidate division KSB1 bacterium]|nr:aminotransferase class I/II-fold pyridoxal phosphate-dependent enzyme [candidate division KSB1 bacterium]NIR68749.1 aminotransferase class I/II-fold pyridoxal phosphate-dependent enzyme [candidate division KSB1 bacterium]NIS25565.1 aminotransferase class I/II-fold pyridoxal phosphate-dependent enzyme [candidate division KSB1 bacterium]NIT72459.1 aminotransferase class I/II-fold pyridoxal phosphate-dependent enzyme [candidate division KSB1 bacterium]NIU26243.1 aminotransferase class I/II-fold
MSQSLIQKPGEITVSLASNNDRNRIYKMRHSVYAEELAQHRVNPQRCLTDALDDFNVYIVAKCNKEIAGFVSITPPNQSKFSVDKYLSRDNIPVNFNNKLFEARILTVDKRYRGFKIAYLLMYAAIRWIDSHGGETVMILGRDKILELYRKVGLQPVGRQIKSGAVSYEVMAGPVTRIHERLSHIPNLFEENETAIDWQLGIVFKKPGRCFHGGAFFEYIGEDFGQLERRRSIINADVLDAWFPPSPKVTGALQEHLPWLLQTSAPTGCSGMIETIARARGVKPECVLPGAGSSSLIYRAFKQWLNPATRVLVLDPTYGEYAFVAEQVIGCNVDRLRLHRGDDYGLDLGELETKFKNDYDLIVLVNPNNPTGQHIPHANLEALLQAAPVTTRIWVDETYVEYAGPNQSLEQFAADSENVVVCKSMSKAYALSGVRSAYLCAGPHIIEELQALSPPWAVSLPAQVASVMALQDPEYYAERYAETHSLRVQLISNLKSVAQMDVVPSTTNFILCHLPKSLPDSVTILEMCKQRGLFLRNPASMGSQLGSHALRIAVKDADTNCRMVEVLEQILHQEGGLASSNSREVQSHQKAA